MVPVFLQAGIRGIARERQRLGYLLAVSEGCASIRIHYSDRSDGPQPHLINVEFYRKTTITVRLKASEQLLYYNILYRESPSMLITQWTRVTLPARYCSRQDLLMMNYKLAVVWNLLIAQFQRQGLWSLISTFCSRRAFIIHPKVLLGLNFSFKMKGGH